MTSEFKRIIEIIEENTSFLLISHIDPDGDAIGSLIALTLLLERKGKKAVAYNRDGVPKILRFLDCADMIVSTPPESDDFQVAIFLECPNVGRAGQECEQVIQNIPLLVNIDHHLENTRFGHLNIVEPKLCAVGEIVYSLFDAMNEPIDIAAANAIYTAIMTDTGSYKYSNTTSRAHEISARLIKIGVDPNKTHQEIFENIRPQAALISASAHGTLQIDGPISCITITKKMLEEAGAGPEDTDEIVNFGRPISGVEVALLFRETDNGTKVSLRSNNIVEVNKIAAQFGGGGHLRAAGCTIEGDMKLAKKEIFTAVRKALEEDRKGVAGADER